MRISELVGINIDDLNFMSNEVRIVRKGGNQDVLVFGSEVREALLNYMLRRENMTAQPGHEKALFLSMQNKRMTVRAIENLVKKYAALAAPLKRSPRISCAAHTEPCCTVNPEIFTLLRMF